MLKQAWIPAFFALAGACGCVAVAPDGSTPAGSAQEIAFTLKQKDTNCDVTRATQAIGRVHGKQTKVKVSRDIHPLELTCTGKDASRLAAKLKPVAGSGPGGFVFIYPDKVTVDMAARKVFVPEGWQVE
jgi:hypothetical protein